jgi:hypothetical protein
MLPKGEPRLGKRGLYGTVGGRSPADRERAMLWLLNQSDGRTSLLDIAARSGIAYGDTRLAADELAAAGLLKESGAPARPASGPATRRPARRQQARPKASVQGKQTRRKGDRR